MPLGLYQGTLHFAEGFFREPGNRRFDVIVEGEPELVDYEPHRVGFATADKHIFTTTVDDEVLDIEFVPRIDIPKISAIEIEQLQ